MLYCQPRFLLLYNYPQKPYTCLWGGVAEIKVHLQLGDIPVCSLGEGGSPGVSPAVAWEGAAATPSPAPAQLNFPQLASSALWERHQTELISEQQHPVALQAGCLHVGLRWTGVRGRHTRRVSTAVHGHPPRGGGGFGVLSKQTLLQQYQDPIRGREREKVNTFCQGTCFCAV